MRTAALVLDRNVPLPTRSVNQIAPIQWRSDFDVSTIRRPDSDPFSGIVRCLGDLCLGMDDSALDSGHAAPVRNDGISEAPIAGGAVSGGAV